MNYLEIILSLFFIITVFSFISLAPWVPTKKEDLERINDIIKLKNGESFLEMWCWTARVSFFIASKNPNSNIIWIELSPIFYLISKIKLLFHKQKNIKIIYWDALKLNMETFDAIYVFWLPETITKKIFPKLSRIQNKNFRFISYCFKMTNNYFIEKKYKPEKKLSIYEYKL